MHNVKMHAGVIRPIDYSYLNEKYLYDIVNLLVFVSDTANVA